MDMDYCYDNEDEIKIWDIESEPLQIGQSYTYPQLIELLNERRYPSGKSRMLQFDRWRDRYDLRKLEGQYKYVVDGIRYDIPIPTAQSIAERQKYKTYIYAIILSYLQESMYINKTNSDYAACFISKTDLKKMTGFVNDFYTYTNGKMDKTIFKQNFPTIAGEIEYEINQHASNVVNYCLRKLKEDCYVNYSYETQIVWRESPHVWKVASKQQIDLLRENRRKTLDEFGFDEFSKVYCQSRKAQAEFFRDENEKNAEYGILYHRDAICFWLPKETITKEIERLSLEFNTDEKLESFVRAINERAVKTINGKTDKNLDKRGKEKYSRQRQSSFWNWCFIINELDKYRGTPKPSVCEIEEFWNKPNQYDEQYKEVRRRGIDIYINMPQKPIAPTKQMRWVLERNSHIQPSDDNDVALTTLITQEEIEDMKNIELSDN